MRTTQQFSITLPNEMADLVKTKVATGEYATESEVIRDGLRVLMTRDRAVENWLRRGVGPAYDALKADPARAVPVGKGRAGRGLSPLTRGGLRSRPNTKRPPQKRDAVPRCFYARSAGATSGVLSLHRGDRKSTRLNSSHGYIPYAVFCF